jgi:hypothetical protein
VSKKSNVNYYFFVKDLWALDAPFLSAKTALCAQKRIGLFWYLRGATLRYLQNRDSGRMQFFKPRGLRARD